MDESIILSVAVKRPDLSPYITKLPNLSADTIKKVELISRLKPSLAVIQSKYPSIIDVSDTDVEFVLHDIITQQKTKIFGELIAKGKDLELDDIQNIWNQNIPQVQAKAETTFLMKSNKDILSLINEIEADTEEKISTGFSKLDGILHGGWSKGYFYLFQGLIGTNKSFVLLNLAVQQLLEGKKVCFVTIEMNRNQIMNRMLRALYDVPTFDDVKRKLVQKAADFNLFCIRYYSKSSTATQIEEDLKEAGFDPDIIVIDYLDKMKPTSKFQQSWQEHEIIASDFTKLAQTLQAPVITATQTNRSAANDRGTGTRDFVGYESTGSSFNKLTEAAAVWTILTSDKDYDDVTKERILKFQCNKNRDGEMATTEYILNYSTCRLREATEAATRTIKLSKTTIKETLEERDETEKNFDKYFKQLKDTTTYKQDIKNIDKIYLSSKQKTLLSKNIEAYQAQEAFKQKSEEVRNKWK